LRPETAFVVRRVLESFLRKICKTYNFSADPDSYRELLESYIREAFPGRDPDFYFDIYLDFLVNIVEPATILDQSGQHGESPDAREVKEEVSPELEEVAPEVAEPTTPGVAQKGEVLNLPVIQLALKQLETLGDCLVAIGESREFEVRKKTLVSLGILIRKVTEIIVDLLNNPKVNEMS
jgi:hypothetical protein